MLANYEVEMLTENWGSAGEGLVRGWGGGQCEIAAASEIIRGRRGRGGGGRRRRRDGEKAADWE